MRSKVTIILITIIFLIFMISCSSGEINLTEEANGKTINCAKGQDITITLESNPTTGFDWYISENSKIGNLELINKNYKAETTDKVGVGGEQIFTFKATGKGTANLIIEYKREWEEGKSPEETFEVNIKVN